MTSQNVQKEEVLSTGQVELVYDHIKAFPEDTELSIALINGNDTKYFGTRWNNDTIQHIDNSEHLFEVGSITKVFTATILAFLVVEQKIKLEDPIQNPLGFDMGTNQKITFKQLAYISLITVLTHFLKDYCCAFHTITRHYQKFDDRLTILLLNIPQGTYPSLC